MRFAYPIALLAALIGAACVTPQATAPSPASMLVSHEVATALDAYQATLGTTGRGAFAVSLNGAEYAQIFCPGGSCGAVLPKTQALLNCEVKAQDDCRLVASDRNQLVVFALRPVGWKPQPLPPPPPALSGKEIVARLVDHNVSGKVAGYGPFQTEIKADGSFSGEGPGDISGHWSISVDRFCIDALNGRTLNLCAHMATDGSKLWLIGDDDRLRQFYKMTIDP